MVKNNPMILTEKGAQILRRGGADDCDDDGLLVLELAKLAPPGATPSDLQDFFVALRIEYGESALQALREGHVRFERRIDA